MINHNDGHKGYRNKNSNIDLGIDPGNNTRQPFRQLRMELQTETIRKKMSISCRLATTLITWNIPYTDAKTHSAHRGTF
jgi:hypothetical protein